jgi:hypothetical protein
MLYSGQIKLLDPTRSPNKSRLHSADL